MIQSQSLGKMSRDKKKVKQKCYIFRNYHHQSHQSGPISNSNSDYNYYNSIHNHHQQQQPNFTAPPPVPVGPAPLPQQQQQQPQQQQIYASNANYNSNNFHQNLNYQPAQLQNLLQIESNPGSSNASTVSCEMSPLAAAVHIGNGVSAPGLQPAGAHSTNEECGIREVWAHNLDDEFKTICQIIQVLIDRNHFFTFGRTETESEAPKLKPIVNQKCQKSKIAYENAI